jgi:hypothetical protein
MTCERSFGRCFVFERIVHRDFSQRSVGCVVFRLLKRADAAFSGPSFERGWTGRLHGIGRALDDHDTILRDVAIASAGYDIWVSAFEYRGGMYHSIWASVTFRLEDHANEYVAVDAVPTPRARPAGWSALKPPEPWVNRFRALGLILDQSPTPPRDIVILDVGGGFVVQGLIPAAPGSDERWETLTREIDATAIAATMRVLPAVAKGRVMRLRALGLA